MTKVNRCLTEGRRSFLRRYAGIEAGEECSRWSTVLSAMADGEATAAQLAEARPHLRNCPACRALLGDLHRGAQQAAALMPAGLLVGGGSGGLLSGLLARAGEALAAPVLKVQGALEAASASKVAAVTASAAALAGGGVAVERHGGEPARAADRPAVAAAPAPATDAAAGAAGDGLGPVAGAGPVSVEAEDPGGASRARAAEPGGAPRRSPPSTPRTRDAAAPAGDGAEFAADASPPVPPPATGREPAPAGTPTPPAPPATGREPAPAGTPTPPAPPAKPATERSSPSPPEEARGRPSGAPDEFGLDGG